MTFKEFLESIANAIRNKKGTTDSIKPINFASEIESIETGGGSVEYVTAPDIKCTIPKSLYVMVWNSYYNEQDTANLFPVYALSSSSTTVSNAIVGRDIVFGAIKSDTTRTVTVTGDLEVVLNNSSGVVVRVTGTTQGTITIS